MGVGEPTDNLQTCRARAQRLECLIELARALNSTLSLRPLAEQVVSAAQELTRAESASLLLLEGRTGQSSFEALVSAQGYRARSIALPLDGTVAGTVAQSGVPLMIEDTDTDRRYRSQIDEHITGGSHAVLAVPLRVRGHIIGVLQTFRRTGEGAFTAEDLELLGALGDQAAVAVQNALLFQQSDLVAEFVHEMRTPLTSIIAYASLQRRPGVSAPDSQQFAAIIEGEASRLAQMADQFLDLARLESGRTPVAREQVDVATLIRMAVNVVMPQADAAQIDLQSDVPAGLPPIAGDAQRLHQVMLNLLGNAVKFCSAGDRITVDARAAAREVTVSVCDTGRGIAPDALPRLFERFYRVPTHHPSVPGVGLGLAITRQIVEAHRGRIWVESELGMGTTVSFSLPVWEDGTE